MDLMRARTSGRYLRVGDLLGADALAVVFDEDVGCLAPGYVAVTLAGLAGKHPAREAVHPQHAGI